MIPTKHMRAKQNGAKGVKPKKHLKRSRARAGSGAGAVHGKISKPASGFPVVGVGASAGGLEALEEFFLNVPEGSGMAYVVVTHQHPGHVSLLPELLAKRTPMMIVVARDGMPVRPNCVYLSSAENCLGISGGLLQLVKIKHDGLQLPIDYFFRSLAQDQGERAVGIVLSGTGTDGTLGLRAIKGANGITMTQDPQSAKYTGMPMSAIATGLVDFVLPPKEMTERLTAHFEAMLSRPADAQPVDPNLPERLQKIIFLLRNRTGHDFSAYKPATIGRRVERRMGLHQFKNTGQYLKYLEESPAEQDLLFQELLIGVTSFFRDPEAFQALSRKVLPRLLKSKPDGSIFRVWVPGCSTGEEAYTLAMVMQDCLERINKPLSLQIFATDLDGHAIDAARTGLYPEGISVDVPKEQLSRHFVKEEKSYRLKKNIRELVVFAPQNVVKDPPFTKLDFISCRNLLIYLKGEIQKRLLSLFHYALKPQGILFLGPSESLGEFGNYFGAVDKKWRIFSRKETAAAIYPPAEFSSHPADASPEPATPPATTVVQEPRVAVEFEKLLISRFVPASVVINAQGDISYIHGRTGDYLEPAAGRPRLNLLEMAREGLALDLGSAIRRAAGQQKEARAPGVRVKINGGHAYVNITVSRLREPASLRGLLLVTFEPSPSRAARARSRASRPATKREATRMSELEQELQFTRESLRSTVEELQSSNEELQSTNEELQSSNEELETSREEMQSLNEELQTVNAQLQAKVDALSQTNDDMQNLLNSTSIATLFLDGHLRIKRFTEQAKAVINLIPSDVGRPIGDLVSNLNYDELEKDATEVLRTLHSREREVRTKAGGWRLVRILPYRTMENMIDGLVVTFIDINKLKMASEEARTAKLFAESVTATLREPILVMDLDRRIISVNESFQRFFRLRRRELERRKLEEIAGGGWANTKLKALLERVQSKNTLVKDFSFTHVFPRIGRRVLLVNARRLQRGGESKGLILLAMEDITDKGGKGKRK